MSWYEKYKDYEAKKEKGEKVKGKLSYKLYGLLAKIPFLDTVVSILNSTVSLLDHMEKQWDKGTIGGKIVACIGTGIKIATMVALAIAGNPILLAIAGLMGLTFLKNRLSKFVKSIKEKDKEESEVESENAQEKAKVFEKENVQENVQENAQAFRQNSVPNNVQQNAQVYVPASVSQSDNGHRAPIVDERVRANVNRSRENVQTRMLEKQDEMLECLRNGGSIRFDSSGGKDGEKPKTFTVSMDKGNKLTVWRRDKGTSGKGEKCKDVSIEEILELLVIESISAEPKFTMISGKARSKYEQAFTYLSRSLEEINEDVSDRLTQLADLRMDEGHSMIEEDMENMAYRCTELVFDDRIEIALARDFDIQAQLDRLEKQEAEGNEQNEEVGDKDVTRYEL